MPHLILLPTIAIEVIASLALEASDGFVRLEYLAGALLGFGLSLWLLARASAILPISITYPFGLRSGS